MIRDDALGYRQAKAAPGLRGSSAPKELFEDAMNLIDRNTDALVGYYDAQDQGAAAIEFRHLRRI